jgi:hypothetical protein
VTAPDPAPPVPAGDHDLDDRPGDPVVVEPWLGAPARSYARRPGSVVAVLDRAVARWPDRTAFVDVDGSRRHLRRLPP